MIKPPFDLDSDLPEELEKFREKCAELMSRAVHAAILEGVPAEYLYRWTPDADNNVQWKPLPDVYSSHLEFNGQVWRHQDTDYVSFHVDRRLMEGQLTIDKWATNQRAAYKAELEERLAEAERVKASMEEAARERRREQYEKLREEFEGNNARH